jgi:transposase-like protein
MLGTEVRFMLVKKSIFRYNDSKPAKKRKYTQMHHPDIRTEHLAHFRRWKEGGVLSEKASLRLECILGYLERDIPMAEAAAAFNVAPNTLRRWLDAFDPADPSSLEEKSRRARTVRATQLEPSTVALIREYRVVSPKAGKEEISQSLLRDHGIHASASAIGRVIERECFYFAESPLHKRKRFMAGARVAVKNSPNLVQQEAQPLVPASVPVAFQPARSAKKTLARALVASVLLLVTAAVGFGAGATTASLIGSTDETRMCVASPIPHPTHSTSSYSAHP